MIWRKCLEMQNIPQTTNFSYITNGKKAHLWSSLVTYNCSRSNTLHSNEVECRVTGCDHLWVIGDDQLQYLYGIFYCLVYHVMFSQICLYIYFEILSVVPKYVKKELWIDGFYNTCTVHNICYNHYFHKGIYFYGPATYRHIVFPCLF